MGIVTSFGAGEEKTTIYFFGFCMAALSPAGFGEGYF
jgi:hypothetical protein